MLVRASLLLSALAFAAAMAGCSSLTRPDEIAIAPEPAPPPKPAAAAPRIQPPPGGAAGVAGAAGHAPGSGG